ncbi:MAG: hypothetical protein IKT41_04220 [Clostridia bacterium]|nr:hypothetical protein [Clostridia bacterium]
MERSISVDEKIRRAEEIYNRRNSVNERKTATVNVAIPKNKTKLKKMLVQLLICILIYCIYYLITTTNYVFSADVINKTKEILNKDINFLEIYNNLVNSNNLEDEKELENNDAENNGNSETKQNIEENTNIVQEETPVIQENIVTEENTLSVSEENVLIEETSSFNQMDIDASEIKGGYSLIKPLSGTITSRYGVRNPTTESVPKYHTGIDIAANEGTEIRSAMDGIVSVVSSEGDYRKPC